METTTRSEMAERAGHTFIVRDEHTHSLKRDLDNMLRDTWADVLAETSSLSRTTKRQRTAEGRIHDDQLAFRLVSSMKHPQRIFLDPKPLNPFVSGSGPDCEDDEVQAETRRIRALRVAREPQELADSTRQIDSKPVPVETKVVLANMSLARPLPTLLVTEEGRTRKTVKAGSPRAHESSVSSPHEPRLSCAVLPVLPVPEYRKVSDRKRRKSTKERPPPAYWRPSPELRGKCMGYALGYPSSWAPDRLYVRDAMKRGHAVHDTLE